MRMRDADVVKTRLQVEARTGQTHYKGLMDAFTKICEWCMLCGKSEEMCVELTKAAGCTAFIWILIRS